MLSDHTDDYPATAQKKQDRRAAKFADEIWRAQGFDTTFDETLIKSWVKPTLRLLDSDYIPILTYAEPPFDGYMDIPISPNSKYFPVFQSFELTIPKDRRFPMEFEHLNLFHAKHDGKFQNIWFNDRPEGVKNYKVRKLMKSEFFQYTVS